MLSYFGEFRVHWHGLLAASIGLALGSAFNHYLTNIFAPALIEEFHWSKAQFALIGAVMLINLPFIPLAGRFTDRFGTRVAAMLGFIAVPSGYFAFSMMTGSIYQFFAISIIMLLLGILTTTIVFTRVIVDHFHKARGMALSICMSGPPLVAAVAVPLISRIVAEEGWREGYRTMALLSACAGIVVVALMGRSARRAPPAPAARPKLDWGEFRKFCRNPAFVLLMAGMFFCNFPQVLVASQLVLMIRDSGSPAQLATWIVSLYAMGVVIGRFCSGLALDRISAQTVALCALGLPAVGYVALASQFDAWWVLAGSVLLIGLAQGAEGDIGAYITSRKFPMANYSLIYSFLLVSLGLAASLGSLVLSFTLARTDSFNAFLVMSAIATLIGAAAFYYTGRTQDAEPVPA